MDYKIVFYSLARPVSYLTTNRKGFRETNLHFQKRR